LTSGPAENGLLSPVSDLLHCYGCGVCRSVRKREAIGPRERARGRHRPPPAPLAHRGPNQARNPDRLEREQVSGALHSSCRRSDRCRERPGR
jgi:hypothetical protein